MLEIRVIGQHHTVIRNGVVINEYENLPACPSRAGRTTPTPVRGLVGYLGLQAHGAPQDVVLFRNIRVRDISAE